VFGKKLCKVEQCLNWERRPLRESQKHYAALDAHILVQLIQNLEQKALEEGFQINKYINTLDKRHYNPVFKDEDPFFEYEDDDTADTFVAQRPITAQT
jgi:ribonuclease D